MIKPRKGSIEFVESEKFREIVLEDSDIGMSSFAFFTKL